MEPKTTLNLPNCLTKSFTGVSFSFFCFDNSFVDGTFFKAVLRVLQDEQQRKKFILAASPVNCRS